MRKVLIFGNSASGKSTLARHISASEGLAHLDLDGLAWTDSSPPERLPISVSANGIDDFVTANTGWVIEGCYSDLIELVIAEASEVIFLDLPVAQCLENAKGRPWEPHKYSSKAAQDANLDMLLDWISQYTERDDTFSRAAHLALYEAFNGEKLIYTSNESYFP
ncbi:shikimate kinase [Parahalioglobus pacificus]|uniref:shikimate kinase n=1 Tax=Parahalioglobus pacificus TaxID=930806 RepID=UPI00167C063D|nr:shikimate kinase [Halioglobus pacificus]